jgi:hypothetical protein
VSPAWQIALTLFASITAPLIVVWLNNRGLAKTQAAAAKIRRQEKEEDWARQDEVARKARETAAEQINAARNAATQVKEVARVAAESAAVTAAQLDALSDQTRQIHTLVNSDMTAARQDALDQMRASRLLLIRAAGPARREWSAEDQETITALDERIAEQERILADRLVALRRVEAQNAASAREGGE